MTDRPIRVLVAKPGLDGHDRGRRAPGHPGLIRVPAGLPARAIPSPPPQSTEPGPPGLGPVQGRPPAASSPSLPPKGTFDLASAEGLAKGVAAGERRAVA